MTKKDKRLPNKIISRLVLNGLRWYLQTIFSLHLQNNDTLQLKPPYLIIGNHANFYDGFLVNLFIKEPICFLISDEYFRKPLLRWFLQIEGSIPKKKFLADFSAIKEAIKAKAAGRIIGIFPEGKRNWDGATGEILFPTAKLIKMLNIPVVCVLMKGSHLSFPRWARYKRKGKIIFSYDLVLTPDKIQTSSVEEIYKQISEKFFYREYDYQKKALNRYQGKSPAENLELFLFICPDCHQIGSLYSAGDILICQNCSYQVKYQDDGFFGSGQKQLYFDHPDSWNQWQIHWLKDLMEKRFHKKGEDILIQDNRVNVSKIEKQKFFNLTKKGQLSFQKEGLLLKTEEDRIFCFAFNLIKGVNVQYNDRFEFYYQGQLYRFSFNNPSVSAYKWYKIIELAQNMAS